MCLSPFRLKDRGEWLPCGKCPECRKRHAGTWAFRLQQELKKSDTAYFITLTYDTRFIPITGKGKYTLSKKDLQKFIKRLRKFTGKSGRKIVYYAVGEYGGKVNRPHYHLIIFNAKPENILKAWSYDKAYIKRKKDTFTDRQCTFRRSKSSYDMLYFEVHGEAETN